jgi:hypothetical protein
MTSLEQQLKDRLRVATSLQAQALEILKVLNEHSALLRQIKGRIVKLAGDEQCPPSNCAMLLAVLRQSVLRGRYFSSPVAIAQNIGRPRLMKSIAPSVAE